MLVGKKGFSGQGNSQEKKTEAYLFFILTNFDTHHSKNQLHTALSV